MKINNYNEEERQVSKKVHTLMERNGAPGFRGKYREFVNKYVRGESTARELINQTLVGITNDYC